MRDFLSVLLGRADPSVQKVRYRSRSAERRRRQNWMIASAGLIVLFMGTLVLLLR